jgi:signal transduction histidine kinase
VAQIITEAQGELIYQIQEKKIRLEIQPELPRVFADRNRLLQVFVNLISNAVKYIGAPAQSQIGIGCQELAEVYQFFIKDNGIGIEKQYHEKIFGLFQILNPDQNPNTQGTGVGLTIVKRIIENHGGRVWVESEPGQGATFYFTIPKRMEINQEQ